MFNLKKKLFKNLFEVKFEAEQLNFTEILSQKEKLIVFFPQESNQIYHIFSYINSWKDAFKENIFFLSEFSFSFFQKIALNSDHNFLQMESKIPTCDNSIILNFSESENIKKVLSKCKNAIIADLGNFANLQFIPKPEQAEELISEFVDFFKLPKRSSKINFQSFENDFDKMKDTFFYNKFPNFILDLHNPKISKMTENLIKKLKLYFSANIYLTGIPFKKDIYPNVKNVKLKDLLEIFCFAKVSNIFISDNIEMVELFSNLKVRQIFIGKGKPLKKVKSQNLSEFQNILDLVNMVQEKMRK